MVKFPAPLKTLLLALIIAVSAVGTISLSSFITQGPVSQPLNAQSRGGGSGGVALRPTVPRSRGAGSCGSPCDVVFIRYPRKSCNANSTCQPIIAGRNQGICVQTSCTTSNPCCRIITPVPRSTSIPGGGMTPVPVVSGGIGGGTKPSGSVGQPTGGIIVQPTGANDLPTGGQLPTGVIGDCSGTTAGVPDGKVDLLDFRQLSLEFTGSVNTLQCDFDKNGTVDLIDFNDYFRKGFTAQ